ncbi:MAG: 50S ribosomal protein L18 [Actinobacteria bacterium]|nr:50S ribosomal protein L18 [Actinomycetota bacterium]MCL5887172.1 50S ribosomal protein L18 [Actinomycetota bacterium]
MDRLKSKRAGLARRKTRVRGKVSGTAERPRLCVTRTNVHIYAQLIDDVAGVTLVAASSLDPQVRGLLKSSGNVDAAKSIGETLGRRAVEKGISEIVFDRSGRLYHGRVKALADGARSAGLQF